ncbi:hypothetical protein FQR65_LT05926 [Abscondita terminalis]|nr:hypothetical protein FQR65_LT05926 [Abscondita terminalis]
MTDWFFSLNYACAKKMTNLSHLQETNNLLTSLNVQTNEKIISVKENGLSDANFIITNLMKKIFVEDGCMCLVIMHNTVGHYQNVLKRLGHDFMQKIQSNTVKTIEPLKTIYADIGSVDGTKYLSPNKENIVKTLYLDIHRKINDLLKENNEQVYLVIDDVSHLLDLGVSNKYIISFLNYCVNLTSNPRVSFVVNCHVVDNNDEVVSNCLRYMADVDIEVSPLKTGFSHEVTGVVTVRRRDSTAKSNTFHYKASDRGIKTFAPEGQNFENGQLVAEETISETAVNDKVGELDDIQKDINDLMLRLNSFIEDSLHETDADSGEDGTREQDGLPEKELRYGYVSVEDMYITDGTKPPEINWNAVGPVLHKHVSDLQRLHNLNQLTISVVKRIRNMAQISEALLDEAKKQVQWDISEL